MAVASTWDEPREVTLPHRTTTEPQTDLRVISDRGTVGDVWEDTFPDVPFDALLEWPPDVFALTSRILEATEAYRFAVSPPRGRRWPPDDDPLWQDDVQLSARRWCAWVDGDTDELPERVQRAWRRVVSARELPLDRLATGRAWDVCMSVLTLHALADQACAGLGTAVDAVPGPGLVFRAHARDLLTTRGSLTRADPRRIRVLPKSRLTSVGLTLRSLSRFVAVAEPGVQTVWRKLPAYSVTPGHREDHENILLVPWPLRVRASDFSGSVGPLLNMDEEQFGFFDYRPQEPFDVGLLRRLMDAAMDEVGRVGTVMLPEGAVTPQEIPALEEVLYDHGARILVTGVRVPARSADLLGHNYVHVGIWLGGRWRRYRQHKHHRWCLDRHQILQYHLGATLHAGVLWWEGISVPRRSVQFIETGGVTLASLVCEDLARQDVVAQVVRSVGPSLVVNVLLDGPQLVSRWTARYASVLADDPGCSVLTLTALGMALRSRPEGVDASRVIALWKDPIHGAQEVQLGADAQGVVLSTHVETSTLWTADGRRHPDSPTMAFGGVHELRVDSDGSHSCAHHREHPPAGATLTNRDLARLTSWLEAAAEAVVAAPATLLEVLDAVVARPSGSIPVHVPPVMGYAATALREVTDGLRAAGAADHPLDADEVRTVGERLIREGTGVARLAGRALVETLRQRVTAT